MTRDDILFTLGEAQECVVFWENELEAFDAKAENNVFNTLAQAESVLEDKLSVKAWQDCREAGNCGADNYWQEFIVDGIHYVASLDVEYNRHDKTYYYVEHSDFTITRKDVPDEV